MLAFLARVLFWMGRLVAAICMALAVYIWINPAMAAPYGRVVGMFSLLVVGACVWLIGRVAIHIFGE